MSDDYVTPEARARRLIDEQLVAAGWVVTDLKQLSLFANDGNVAVREVEDLEAALSEFAAIADALSKGREETG